MRGSDGSSLRSHRDMVVRRAGDTESRRTRLADSGTRLSRGLVQIPKRSFPRVLIGSRSFLFVIGPFVIGEPARACVLGGKPPMGLPSEIRVGQTAARTPS
jgi:hypothetical protein